MPNDENVPRTELPKLVDDGNTNNYGEWKTKSYHKLREWDLLQYVEGPTSDPPIIPPLREARDYHGLNEFNVIATVRDLGNIDEHRQALINAKPWLIGNNTTLARIVTAVPALQLHLVQDAIYARQAWESLRSYYQPHNSLRAASIKGQIMTYRCTSDMNVSIWLNDMQRLYNSLCDLETDRMSNREFTLAILDLMPQDNGWMDFVSRLRSKVHDADSQGFPIHSTTFTTAIRDENWHRHRDDHQNSSRIFSARFEAQKRTQAPKRARPTDLVATASLPSVPNKRPRTVNPNKAHLRCSNPHCGPKIGHDTADCIAYTGAKQGQYEDWWRGPWNIHLPASQRTKENNIPPKTHPAYARLFPPAVNQSSATDGAVDRSSTATIQSTDSDAHVNASLMTDTNCHAWNTTACDTVAQATLPILNPKLPRDNTCHHDSGANRHVFHDRSAFEAYESIAPLTVKGFGHALSTTAIGRGTVRLEGYHERDKCSILLRNVLHIPDARTNLISGIELDKAGVVATQGHSTIHLSFGNKILVSGALVNDMYRLNVKIIRRSPPSLASRISDPDVPNVLNPNVSLASRIGAERVTSDFYTASWAT
jgi:hypothetical protein